MGKIKVVKAETLARANESTDKTECLEIDIGLLVKNNGKKQKIRLFSLDKSKNGADLSNTAYKLCTSIVKKHFPDQKITDFDWEFNASAAVTDIDFETKHGVVVGVHFSNEFAATHSCFHSSLENYQKAVDSPLDTSTFLSNGHPERYLTEPTSRTLVHLPNHPAGSLLLSKPHYEQEYLEHYEIVLVDADKAIEFWTEQEKTRFGCLSAEGLKYRYDREPLKGDDVAFPPFHTSIEDSINHILPGMGYPPDLPQAGFAIKDPPKDRGGVIGLVEKWASAKKPHIPEEILFQNGRHRSVNMHRCGAPYIPFLMPKCEETETFKGRFEWKGPEDRSFDLQPPPPTPETIL
jgi:hypothetical protein